MYRFSVSNNNFLFTRTDLKASTDILPYNRWNLTTLNENGAQKTVNFNFFPQLFENKNIWGSITKLSVSAGFIAKLSSSRQLQ